MMKRISVEKRQAVQRSSSMVRRACQQKRADRAESLQAAAHPDGSAADGNGLRRVRQRLHGQNRRLRLQKRARFAVADAGRTPLLRKLRQRLLRRGVFRDLRAGLRGKPFRIKRVISRRKPQIEPLRGKRTARLRRARKQRRLQRDQAEVHPALHAEQQCRFSGKRNVVRTRRKNPVPAQLLRGTGVIAFAVQNGAEAIRRLAAGFGGKRCEAPALRRAENRPRLRCRLIPHFGILSSN